MDKRKFNGGSRKGAGRKKGTGVSNRIKRAVDDFMNDLLQDEEIMGIAINDLKQLSLGLGWIYIIKDKDTGRVKIGVTQRKSPKRRLSQYNAHNMDIDVLFIDKVDYCYEIESLLHDLFSRFRVTGGDWFELNDKQILTAINEICKHKHEDYA